MGKAVHKVVLEGQEAEYKLQLVSFTDHSGTKLRIEEKQGLNKVDLPTEVDVAVARKFWLDAELEGAVPPSGIIKAMLAGKGVTPTAQERVQL